MGSNTGHIAIAVAIATLTVTGIVIITSTDKDLKVPAFLLLSNIFFMVATFYFQRTNHVKTGGVGGTDSR